MAPRTNGEKNGMKIIGEKRKLNDNPVSVLSSEPGSKHTQTGQTHRCTARYCLTGTHWRTVAISQRQIGSGLTSRTIESSAASSSALFYPARRPALCLLVVHLGAVHHQCYECVCVCPEFLARKDLGSLRDGTPMVWMCGQVSCAHQRR